MSTCVLIPVFANRRFPAMKYMDPEYPEVMESLPKICLTSGKGDFLRKVTLRYAKKDP